MLNQDWIAALKAKFELLIHNEYHVQIPVKNGKHDLWFSDQYSGVKFKACGQRGTVIIRHLDQLLRRLGAYDYEKTDLALMQRIPALLRKVEGKRGIWVDAGWSAGRAKVAIIWSNGHDYDITIRQIECPTSTEAETWGIRTALDLYPGDETIFTDCQSLEALDRRVKWIPRERNKNADRFANLRHKK